MLKHLEGLAVVRYSLGSMSPALFQPEETRPHWILVYFPPSLVPGWKEGEGWVWRASPFLSSLMIIFGLNTQTSLEEVGELSISPNCGVLVPVPSLQERELKHLCLLQLSVHWCWLASPGWEVSSVLVQCHQTIDHHLHLLILSPFGFWCRFLLDCLFYPCPV